MVCKMQRWLERRKKWIWSVAFWGIWEGLVYGIIPSGRFILTLIGIVLFMALFVFHWRSERRSQDGDNPMKKVAILLRNREEIQKLYWREHWSHKKIADYYGVSEELLGQVLGEEIEYSIKSPQGQSNPDTTEVERNTSLGMLPPGRA